MAAPDIVSAILHYKRNIEKIARTRERALKYEDRLLHCLNKLYRMPIKVIHLHRTGIGRTVNALRKIEGEKGLGEAAKALVCKWKTMVLLEDEDAAHMNGCPGSSVDNDDCSNNEDDIDDEKIELSMEPEESIESEDDVVEQPKSGPNENRNGKKRKNEAVGSETNHFKRELLMDDYDNMAAKRVWENGLEDRIVKKSKSHPKCSHSCDPSRSSSFLKSYKNEKEERKTKYEGERKKHENSQEKHHKSSSQRNSVKQERKDKMKAKFCAENDGFDSQSGASFADALGSIIVKKSPKKRINLNTTASPSPSSSDGLGDGAKEKKDMKDLLFSQPKLVPLEPDLVATLPTPTPYYKPHPSYIPTQEAVRKRVQAEEDALTTIMSNKNTRTKVYSGVKGGLSYVPSLYECCCRILQQHIDALEYTGGIPFSLLKPVLEGATPSQLYRFEHFNPYIVEDTDDLWKFHVGKEFRNEERQEFESWRDMYLRCTDAREKKYKAVTASILQRTIENAMPVRKAKLAYIDSPKPPRNVLMKQVKNGTAKPDVSRLLGKNNPEAVKVLAPKQPTAREPPVLKVKPKVAPLMQKTLKSIKMTRFKR